MIGLMKRRWSNPRRMRSRSLAPLDSESCMPPTLTSTERRLRSVQQYLLQNDLIVSFAYHCKYSYSLLAFQVYGFGHEWMA